MPVPYLVQMLSVLFQQAPDLRIRFLLEPVMVERTVLRKRFSGIERQQLDVCLCTQYIFQGLDSGIDRVRRQDTEVGWTDNVEYKIACIGGNAVVRDLFDAHKLLRRLSAFIFLLFFHTGSSHSKICCSVI